MGAGRRLPREAIRAAAAAGSLWPPVPTDMGGAAGTPIWPR